MINLIDKILLESKEPLNENKIITFPKENGNFILLMGSPGSGKSYVINNLLNLKGFKHLTSDNWIELNARKNNIDLKNSENTEKLKNELDHKFKNFRNTFIKSNETISSIPNIVIEITGKNTDSVSKVLKLAGENYITTLIFVKTSLRECLKRNNERTRKVPENVLISLYDETIKTFEKSIQLFENVWEIKNEDPHYKINNGIFTRSSDKIIKIK